MDFKRHRKLNLNAPILSTRRLSSVVAADTSYSSSSLGTIQNTTSERVPFSWEKEAGKPKYMERSVPELPSCHWFPSNETPESDADNVDDFFSDAMDDVFSLSEALDIVQKRTEKENSENNDGLKLKLAESNGYQSPTYMINRFLPDATALAASSSALNFPTNFEENVWDTCSYSARHSCDSSSLSPKGCGLDLLFPWMKHKFCAVESPVTPCSTNLQKHQRDSKQKKHRRSSSSYIPCTNVKKDI